MQRIKDLLEEVSFRRRTGGWHEETLWRWVFWGILELVTSPGIECFLGLALIFAVPVAISMSLSLVVWLPCLIGGVALIIHGSFRDHVETGQSPPGVD